MAAALQPSGRLLIKTDHGGYAERIAEVLSAEPELVAVDAAEAFAGLPVTGFEHKYRDQGREIFPFAFERT
jgi:tRNA G46 methylase TrmB